MTATLLDRLNNRTTVDAETGCWNWTGATTVGYGVIRAGKLLYTHRVGYELLKGPIPADHELHHICENKRCWNPEHTFPVLRRDHPGNLAYISAQKTHCPKGHPYDDVHTYRYNGHRNCYTCLLERSRQRDPEYMRQYRSRKKAEAMV